MSNRLYWEEVHQHKFLAEETKERIAVQAENETLERLVRQIIRETTAILPKPIEPQPESVVRELAEQTKIISEQQTIPPLPEQSPFDAAFDSFIEHELFHVQKHRGRTISTCNSKREPWRKWALAR